MTSDLQSPSKEVKAIAVAVIMERRPVEGMRWVSERWQAVGVVTGERAQGREFACETIHADEEGEQYLWTGFTIELYNDEGMSYYSNLMGDKPSIFVVCSTDEEERLAPFLVTVSYDEAASYMETDDAVFSVPIPQDIYLWLERYVLENYVPEKTKKRKRKDWKTEHGRRE